jgi:hypothetical protein
MLAINDSMSSDERRWRKAARPEAPPAASASVSSGMVRLVRLVSSSASSPLDSRRLPIGGKAGGYKEMSSIFAD